MTTKKANCITGLFICRVFIFSILFFFCSYISAQDGFGTNQKAVIVVKGGAEIFSVDENFNGQIIDNKVVAKNAQVGFGKTGDKVLMVLSSKKEVHQNESFKAQMAKAEKQKQQKVLKELKSKIDDFESRKENFDVNQLTVFPSSESFIVSSRVNQDYVVPTYSQHDLCCVNCKQDQYIVKSALDFLHSQEYSYYNNKSLDFCFSEVFSVRPPPAFI